MNAVRVKASWWLPGYDAPCLCPHQRDGESCCNGPAGTMCCAGCVEANRPRREFEQARKSWRWRLRAWLARRRNPGSGWCRRCGRPWGLLDCEEHPVWYRGGPPAPSGWAAFAACVDCWPNMHIVERVSAMRLVHGARPEWAEIEAAIHSEMSGKAGRG